MADGLSLYDGYLPKGPLPGALSVRPVPAPRSRLKDRAQRARGSTSHEGDVLTSFTAARRRDAAATCTVSMSRRSFHLDRLLPASRFVEDRPRWGAPLRRLAGAYKCAIDSAITDTPLYLYARIPRCSRRPLVREGTPPRAPNACGLQRRHPPPHLSSLISTRRSRAQRYLDVPRGLPCPNAGQAVCGTFSTSSHSTVRAWKPLRFDKVCANRQAVDRLVQQGSTRAAERRVSETGGPGTGSKRELNY